MKKVKRKIVNIDEGLCNGCGECIPACPEQAIQIVETPQGPKARLVKEIYCDGLGACLGNCPTGALTITEKESEPYDEEITIARIRDLAPEMLPVHLRHLKEHADELPEHHSHSMPHGMTSCPSAKILKWEEKTEAAEGPSRIRSELRQWPVQLHLVPPTAPYFKNADLVLVADCVPFSYPNFHQDFLKGNALAVGCPKLDDVDAYIERLSEIISVADLKSLKVVFMEVPCCAGLVYVAQEAIKRAGKRVPFEAVKIGIKGERMG